MGNWRKLLLICIALGSFLNMNSALAFETDPVSQDKQLYRNYQSSSSFRGNVFVRKTSDELIIAIPHNDNNEVSSDLLNKEGRIEAKKIIKL